MLLRAFFILVVLPTPAIAIAEKQLATIQGGAVLAGPGSFRHDGELFVDGKVTLKHMTLDLHGPIRVAAGATLELDDVNLVISDPDGAPNGTSGLNCDGPAHLIVRHSAMIPVSGAHPMWFLQGTLDVDRFTTSNSEFHLKEVQARLNNLKIFELEISHESQVIARGLDLVFLSTQSSESDHLQFMSIPVDHTFTRTLDLGSDSHATLTDSRIQLFLLYVHGRTDATLAHMDRVQLALSPRCDGTLRLPAGRLGSAAKPAVFPDAKSSNCPFHIKLVDVNVDTWDIYAEEQAILTVEDSRIDELTAGDSTTIAVRNSTVYADWLGISGDARIRVENSTVGSIALASERPDLATSQIRVSDRGRASFSGVRFDCGIVTADDASVSIDHAITPPKYVRHSGNSVILLDGHMYLKPN